MKRICAGVLSAVVFCFSVSPLQAGGIFAPPGGRANNLGYAFVAVADNLTAIYWNPAGLSQLKGAGA